jgi:hypothetical protein
MAEPFELIASPFEVWLAPVGTTFPDVDADPAGPWALLGVNGAYDIDSGGITVTHAQEVNIYRGLKGTGPLKAFRTSEDLKLAFTLHDLSLEEYAKIINKAPADVDTSGTTAGGATTRSLNLHQGPNIQNFALLARGASPYDDDNFAMQYQVPKVYQSGSPAPVFQKGIPAGLALEFTALEDLNATTEEERFGTLVAQDTAGS